MGPLVELFDQHDAPYHEWRHANSAGWVVNTRRHHDASYVVLHRATCRSIGSAARANHPDPFTGGSYVKICSTDREALSRWLMAHGFGDISHGCGLCAP